jgi:hypothetical protein
MQAGGPTPASQPLCDELGGDPEMKARAWEGDERRGARHLGGQLSWKLDVSRTLPFPSTRFEMRHAL